MSSQAPAASQTTSAQPNAPTDISGYPEAPHNGLTTSPFLYAIFTAVLLLFIFCFASVGRQLAIRRQRRSGGLVGDVTPWDSSGTTAVEIPTTVPIMHEVSLRHEYLSEKKLGLWSDIMPLSSSIVPSDGDTALRRLHHDPDMGATFASTLGELTLVPEYRRRVMRRRQRAEDKRSTGQNQNTNGSSSPSNVSRRLLASVVVAMPSPGSRHSSHNRSTEGPLPEVALGTCDTSLHIDSRETFR